MINNYIYKVWILDYKSNNPFRQLNNRRLLTSLQNLLIMYFNEIDPEYLEGLFKDHKNDLLDKYPINLDPVYKSFLNLGITKYYLIKAIKELEKRTLKYNLNPTEDILKDMIAKYLSTDNPDDYDKDTDKNYEKFIKIYEYHCRIQLVKYANLKFESYSKKLWKINSEDILDDDNRLLLPMIDEKGKIKYIKDCSTLAS